MRQTEHETGIYEDWTIPGFRTFKWIGLPKCYISFRIPLNMSCPTTHAEIDEPVN